MSCHTRIFKIVGRDICCCSGILYVLWLETMGIGFVKEMYFESAILIHRQLEDELQAEKSRWQAERDEFMQEIERLKEDNDRQQKLLSVNLTKSPQTQTEAFMQHEITRLTSENLVSLVGYDEITWFT